MWKIYLAILLTEHCDSKNELYEKNEKSKGFDYIFSIAYGQTKANEATVF